MSHKNILDPQEENRQLLARLWDGVKIKGDGKCYFPCSQCRGFNRIRLNISIAKIHCRGHGHIKGGHEYHPLVSCSLYMSLY
jgi:hypothetical protein